MRPKLPVAFASFETNSGPSVRVVVSEIFVALILDFLIFKSCEVMTRFLIFCGFVSEEDDLPSDGTAFYVISLEP